jgi:hypothetical protein
VAEIGEVIEVAALEEAAAFHRREYGTDTLAIAAGVADLQLARSLGLEIS